ncbi:hypothetical protein HIM_03446 [Hirsutella minnesotensis 3608]|uniref:Centrosomin N-terminal motif 1 domain-containing protein n=1 Tax=Hirsutella minnesotensis 3608 TaxID=1043627 RepID=A0A0F7ZQE8_9HYPO|nr:hypothetical protein HIM_03446 [Hirsutella minnesotensis 3608]
MEGSQSQTRRGSRASYPRGPSRSSGTSWATPPSASLSTSSVPGSPQLPNSKSSPRHHQGAFSKSPGSPRSASKTMAYTSTHGSPEAMRQPALSSFLQEKLQRERKAESEKLAFSAGLSRTDMSASVDIGRIVQSSPFKAPEAIINRPRSSTGTEPPKKKGLAVKEMEQVVSSLHKQNFDLKLELYHRRERQTALEERLEFLETEHEKAQDITERLLEELEKRDKAVEEAVAMIVTLEAKVDQLVMERCMVQQVEAAGQFTTQEFDSRYSTPAPKTPSSASPKKIEVSKVVNRVPSFLSDRSENTEHLRNVYLGVRGSSMLSLPPVAEGSADIDGTPAQGLGSPTLSVLSESSFLSVYGAKDASDESGQSPPMFVDEPLTLDGLDSTFGKPSQEEAPRPRRRAASVGKVTGVAKPPPRSSTAVPFQSITGVIGHESPLQRIMRLDPSYTNAKEPGNESKHARDLESSPILPSQKSSRRQTKEEKRDALRRVLTDAPGGARLHDNGLPPTPDTISTSTLHRFKSSNENLSREQDLGGVAPDFRASDSGSGATLGIHRQPQNVSAHVGNGTDRARGDHRRPSGPRPQSARETIRFYKRGDDWESDSDDTDAHSLESSLDIWLRESAKPDKDGRKISPDLFNFPTNETEGGWDPDSMPSEHSGNPATGSGIPASQSHGHIHGLLALRHQLFPWASGPLPPDRRSSLHAQTNSTADAANAKSALSQDATRASAGPRHRHGRHQSDDSQMRSENRTPVQHQQPPPQAGGEQKRYPPISGQHGARAGLNRLLRRSMGATSAPQAVSEDAAAGQGETANGNDGAKSHSTMGVLSWGVRSVPLDDDRSGATPPPIVLNPRQVRRNTCDSERPASPSQTAESAPGAAESQDVNTTEEGALCAQQQENGGTGPATGARRKWLPAFGRPNSSKNKAG